MSDLIKAREIAERAHKGQTRKNGEPYINHAIRVSEAAGKYSNDAAIVGMLHDVLEDNKSFNLGTFKRLGFSSKILVALAFITKTDGESYADYIRDMHEANKRDIPSKEAVEIAIQVKLADIEDNLNGAKGTIKDKYELARYILTECK
jgi:(p)ppGpp synthase/HD superfamily hydrolase